MMPVLSTRSAATQETSGSNSRASVAVSIRTGTPFATARSCSARSRGTSVSSTATMSLPQMSKGMSCSAAKADIERLPAVHILAFIDPGL